MTSPPEESLSSSVNSAKDIKPCSQKTIQQPASPQPTTLPFDTIDLGSPDNIQCSTNTHLPQSSGMDFIADSSTAPTPNSVWTAAFYNTIVHGAPDYTNFPAFQQSHIQQQDLLSALTYAANCRTREEGEYNLAIHDAKTMGLQHGVHFELAAFGPLGPMFVGQLSDWKGMGEEQLRDRLVGIVKELRLLRESTVRIRETIRDMVLRWKIEEEERMRRELQVVQSVEAEERGVKEDWKCCVLQ